MKSSAATDPRRIACDVLHKVENGAYSDLTLDTALSHSSLDQRDRRFVTELVYGLLRLRGRVDFALAQFCDQPLLRLQPEVLLLLRIGAYQLLEMDRVPAHAAVNSTVNLARSIGMKDAAGLLNAVLRTLDRQRDTIPWPDQTRVRDYLQHVCSLPVWLAKEIMRLLPNREACEVAEAFAEAAPPTLRVNTLKMDRDSYLDVLRENGYEARACTFAPEGIVVERRGERNLPGDTEGWYQLQDEASMLMAHLLDVRPGLRILDACAAPGSKTTHLAALTDNQAQIVAFDKSPQRIILLEQGVRRLGCTGVTAAARDLTLQFDPSEGQSFDRILLDAPCSGIGVLRRNPEGRWTRSPAKLRELANLQLTLLEQVAPLLRPGGLLLYSVCSFSHMETDAVIDQFLSEHPEYQRSDMSDRVPQHWQELFSANGTLRTWPHRHQGMDAFFAARLCRLG